MDVIHPMDADAVTLRPWCTLSAHFTQADVFHADDGFHHYGPEIAIRTSDRESIHRPETVVKVALKSWTCPLDGDPGPTIIELQAATTGHNADVIVDLTLGEAGAVSGALAQLAEIAAQHAPAHGRDHPDSGG